MYRVSCDTRVGDFSLSMIIFVDFYILYITITGSLLHIFFFSILSVSLKSVNYVRIKSANSQIIEWFLFVDV